MKDVFLEFMNFKNGVIDIKKLELPKCPYCGEKLLYLESFLVKNKTAYECKCCDYFSEVVIKTREFGFLILSEFVLLVIFLFAVLFGGSFCLFGLFLILFIFAGFYAFSPFSIKLCKMRKNRIPKQKNSSDLYQNTDDESREIYSN